MQYSLNFFGTRFCPLQIKITQFPGGFHLNNNLLVFFSKIRLNRMVSNFNIIDSLHVSWSWFRDLRRSTVKLRSYGHCGSHRKCSLCIKRQSVKWGLTVLSEVADDLSTNNFSLIWRTGSESQVPSLDFFTKLVQGIDLIFVFNF